MDVNSESNELETRPKKPNLAEIKEIRIKANRTADRFTDYEGVMDDRDRTTKQNNPPLKGN